MIKRNRISLHVRQRQHFAESVVGCRSKVERSAAVSHAFFANQTFRIETGAPRYNLTQERSAYTWENKLIAMKSLQT